MSKYLLLLEDNFFIETSLLGRLIFGFASLILWMGLVLILDRIGLPIQINFVLSLIFSAFGLIVIGILVRTMRLSAFYVLNRQLNLAQSALSMAALGSALVIPAAIYSGGWNLPAQACALIIGFGLFGLITAPVLRAAQVLTPIDLIMARFPHPLIRGLLILTSTCACLLIAAAGFQLALDWLEALLPVARGTLAFTLAALVAIGFAAGGQRAVIWIGLASFVATSLMILTPLSLSFILDHNSSAPLPLPVLGDAHLWAKASALMQNWAGHNQFWHWPAVILLGVGLSSFMPLMMTALATRTPRIARQSGFVAGLLSAGCVMALALALAQSTLAIQTQSLERNAHELPAAFYIASGAHLISICDKNPASPALATAACNRDGPHGVLTPDDMSISPIGLILAQSGLTPSLLALAGLLYASIIALALALCASGLMSGATLLGQDGLARLSKQNSLTSRRLALTRLIMLIMLWALARWAQEHHLAPDHLIAAACTLSLSLYLPLYGLIYVWRARVAEALVATCSALLVVLVYIGLAPAPQSWDEWGVMTIYACSAGLLIGWAASWTHKNRDPIEGRAFIAAVMQGHGAIYTHES